jgi:prophage tail gpP-like protein
VIRAGGRCELWVNDRLELTGIVDKVNHKTTKQGNSLIVEGRDLMGLLVDSYCETFVTVAGKTMKQLAELLIDDVPFIERSQVLYQENLVGKLKGRKKKGSSGGILASLDSSQKLSQIEPGMTVFEVLKTYAVSRGMIFFALPDGTFIFGRPKTSGEPMFSIVMRRDGVGNNVMEGERVEDISKRYSRVTVVGQQQGADDLAGASQINTKAVKEDDSFPFDKPFVTKNNNDSLSPKEHARLLLEKQRREGDQLIYKAPRHSQDGMNWTISELYRVEDELRGLKGTYLIFGRTFELRKTEGPTTKLKLGPLGMVA